MIVKSHNHAAQFSVEPALKNSETGDYMHNERIKLATATLRHRYVSKGGYGASRLVAPSVCEGVLTALEMPSRRKAIGAIGIFSNSFFDLFGL
jgi:hypothetical protein